MVNKVFLIGNLGKNPELKTTTGGQSVCKLNIATKSSYKKNDEWIEDTQWHRVIVWGKQGENCNSYLAKGSQVFIEGKLKTRDYDQDGIKKYVTEVIANEVKFLSKIKKETQPESNYDSDEIPF